MAKVRVVAMRLLLRRRTMPLVNVDFSNGLPRRGIDPVVRHEHRRRSETTAGPHASSGMTIAAALPL